MNVITVLRTGGEYEPRHVDALYRGVCLNMEDPNFICLTDAKDVDPLIAEPLKHRWPKWWSKLEVFRIPGPAIYMDLDTIVMGGIEDLAEVARMHRFTMLRDVYRKGNARGSGIMTWSGDMSHLYDKFAADPDYSLGGDQNWIEANENAEAIQDLLPTKVVSFKADLNRKAPRGKPSIVFFHGRPRPWQQDQIPYPYDVL